MLERRMQLDEINNARNLAQQWLKEHGVIETNSETLRQEQAAERERLTEAAEQGEAQAQYDLGINCLHGKGAKEDRAEAASWIRKSAEQGYAQAQFELGNMLTMGTIVRRDHVEAACWYRKAAEQGNMDGMHGLSRVHLVGQGVPKDYVQGHFWLSLAKANGDESSDNWLNVITKHMTNDQIAEAERLAREWLEKHGK